MGSTHVSSCFMIGYTQVAAIVMNIRVGMMDTELVEEEEEEESTLKLLLFDIGDGQGHA